MNQSNKYGYNTSAWKYNPDEENTPTIPSKPSDQIYEMKPMSIDQAIIGKTSQSSFQDHYSS
jgi:hypothetical protein